MLDAFSSVRDSTLLFILAVSFAVVTVAFGLTIGTEYMSVPLVFTLGTGVFGALRRRDGD